MCSSRKIDSDSDSEATGSSSYVVENESVSVAVKRTKDTRNNIGSREQAGGRGRGRIFRDDGTSTSTSTKYKYTVLWKNQQKDEQRRKRYALMNNTHKNFFCKKQTSIRNHWNETTAPSTTMDITDDEKVNSSSSSQQQQQDDVTLQKDAVASTMVDTNNTSNNNDKNVVPMTMTMLNGHTSTTTQNLSDNKEVTNGDSNDKKMTEKQGNGTLESATNDNDDDDDDDEKDVIGVEVEEDEEEMKLFNTLQHEEEVIAHEHEHDVQPKQITAAPKLLQAAIQKGQVQADDDSVNENENDIVNKSSDKVKSSEKDVAVATTVSSPEVHIHKRGNQLDFLLSKASEYSNFIAKDLDELQSSMSEQARRAYNKLEKKRSANDNTTTTKMNGKGNKKQKTSTNTEKEVVLVGSNSSTRPIFIQPPNLSKDCLLKDYQLEGVRWLASLYENGVSGILADEMGLGKTIQCVALIAHLLTKGVSGPFLIVAPLATLPNWVREFEKWLPSHPVIRYHGPAPVREALLKGVLHPKLKRNLDFPFIVTSYEVAIRDQSKLEKLSEFTYLIVDEGHRLKNHRCLLLNSLKKLKCANRLLLTGTPIQNTLDELWSLLNFVNPQIFDDLSVFQSWFGFKDIGQKTQGATDEESILLEERKNRTVTKLHEILRPFLLRRVKVDVLSEMPPKKEVIVYSGISKLQAGYADLIDKGTLRDTLINQGIENGRTLSQTNKMMNHRKNINHPFIFGEPIDPATGIHLGSAYPQLLVRASGKFALLDRMLSRLHADGHQVLIFSQMTRVLSVMEDYLNYRKWNYCRIDGSTDIDERQRQMDVFNAEKTNGINGTRNSSEDRCFVFLLSTRAGGLGINLTGGDTCIIFDSDWNPHADSQAMDRCHRMGQDRPVAVYRLLTVNSVDIEMMEKQVSKKKLERMTIAGGDFRKAGRRSKGEIDVEHLASLLQSDIKDMNAKGGDVEDIKIDDDEFDMIMDRQRLFSSGPDAIPTEGKMYDIIDAAVGDLLGKMTTE